MSRLSSRTIEKITSGTAWNRLFERFKIKIDFRLANSLGKLYSLFMAKLKDVM